jgi:hypothetical protein
MKSICLAVLLLSSGSSLANAQETTPAAEGGGFAPAAGGPGFGTTGQFAVSMGATADEHLFFHKQSGGGWQLHLAPALDYFVIPRLSVGGVLAYTHGSGGGGTNASGSNAIAFAARAGYALDFDDRFGVWPLAGVVVDWFSANHTSTTNTFFSVYAPFLFHVAPHFFVGAGPSFLANLSGPATNQYGIDSLIGGYF